MEGCGPESRRRAAPQTEVRLKLPPELGSVKATGGGRVSGKQVVWDLGTLGDRQTQRWRSRASARSCPAEPDCSRPRPLPRPPARTAGPGRRGRWARTARPSAARDHRHPQPADVRQGLADPIGVGQRTKYTIRSQECRDVGGEAGGSVGRNRPRRVGGRPAGARPIRATGPGPRGPSRDTASLSRRWTRSPRTPR